MAKEEPESEQIITRPVQETAYHSHPQTDTKTVVIAVGASVVLFVIGLILGFLLGHQTADNDRRGLMNSTTNTHMFRNRLQTQATTN